MTSRLSLLAALLVFSFSSAAFAQTSEQTSEPAEAEWERWDGATIGWQAGAGVAGGIVGFLVTLPAAAFVADVAGDCRGEFGCLEEIVLSSFVGGALGTAAGISLAGYLDDGDGSFFGAALGSLLGLGTGLLLSYLGDRFVSGDDDVIVVGGVVTAVIGSIGLGIVGYHVTASEQLPAVTIAPIEGGATVGVSGRF